MSIASLSDAMGQLLREEGVVNDCQNQYLGNFHSLFWKFYLDDQLALFL